MAEGLQIYPNEKTEIETNDTIKVYKVYSRADVRYMAKFVLTDEEGNKTSRSFPWHEAVSDKGLFLLKRAFEGRGSTPIIITEIEIMHKFLKDKRNDDIFKQQNIQIGQASSIPNNLIKQQLELWYDKAFEKVDAIELIKTAKDEEVKAKKKIATAQETAKTAKSDKNDKIQELQDAEKELEALKLNKKYSLDCYVNVEDIAGNKNDKADYSNVPILVREEKGENQILYILSDSFKKWIELLGVPYSSFKKKLVDNNIMYNPSSTPNPRIHFRNDCPWYFGICINKLDRMDFMV